jgi:hypothetical protein
MDGPLEIVTGGRLQYRIEYNAGRVRKTGSRGRDNCGAVIGHRGVIVPLGSAGSGLPAGRRCRLEIQRPNRLVVAGLVICRHKKAPDDAGAFELLI